MSNIWGPDSRKFNTDRKRMDEYVRIAKEFEKKTGCQVRGFDPGFSVSDPVLKSSVSIPYWLAVAVIGESPEAEENKKNGFDARARKNEEDERKRYDTGWTFLRPEGSFLDPQCPKDN